MRLDKSWLAVLTIVTAALFASPLRAELDLPGNSNVDMTVGFYARYYNESADTPFRTQGEFTVASQEVGPSSDLLTFPEKTDIELRAKAVTGTGIVSGFFQGYLISTR